MRFHTELDRQLFLLEIGKKLCEADTPDDHRIFIKRRDQLVSLLKDFRKSRTTEREWKLHRNKFVWAFRQFARSPEGKRFHRKLGRFLATRNFLDTSPLARARGGVRENLMQMITEELDFYQPLEIQVAFELILEQIS